MKRLFIVLKELGEAFPCGVVFFFFWRSQFWKRLFIILKELGEAFPCGFVFFFFFDKPIFDGFTHLFK